MEMKHIVPMDGVALYTGHGHAPFEAGRAVALVADHADALIGAKVARTAEDHAKFVADRAAAAQAPRPVVHAPDPDPVPVAHPEPQGEPAAE